ncbi:hypothetical protein BH11MYX1_BH11MYX1_01960 [soil metagenome]
MQRIPGSAISRLPLGRVLTLLQDAARTECGRDHRLESRHPDRVESRAVRELRNEAERDAHCYAPRILSGFGGIDRLVSMTELLSVVLLFSRSRWRSCATVRSPKTWFRTPSWSRSRSTTSCVTNRSRRVAHHEYALFGVRHVPIGCGISSRPASACSRWSADRRTTRGAAATKLSEPARPRARFADRYAPRRSCATPTGRYVDLAARQPIARSEDIRW